MSDANPSQDKTSKKKNSQKDWIVRGVVFGVLGVLLVFALMDFFEKKNAEGTYDAWQTAMQERENDGSELYAEDLEGLMKGSADYTEEKLTTGTVRRYTWGVIREYPIEVLLDNSVKPAVAELIPPSEVSADGPKELPPVVEDEKVELKDPVETEEPESE
ncbi:hypothetical protein [Thalassoroseus pseudoceratinae]|uniref:hypothetical protein n=1 Tax=Thalassoroseus pseudoceratinae TaxID=2713176 RepID=UPI00141FA6CA|nr:hypothetical protein [Thalassoroseus pseudoceratinae]